MHRERVGSNQFQGSSAFGRSEGVGCKFLGLLERFALPLDLGCRDQVTLEGPFAALVLHYVRVEFEDLWKSPNGAVPR